jgi:hypothetical protein
MVVELLRDDPRLQDAAHMSLSGDAGNPIALYVARAQHDTRRFQSAEDAPVYYRTVVSIVVSLDIFTDEAAWESAKRFESIFSELLVHEIARQTNDPLTEDQLKATYKEAFQEGIKELVGRAIERLEWQRQRASAVFKVTRLMFPKVPSAELDAIIHDGLRSAGIPETADAISREKKAITREFSHLFNQFIIRELRARGIDDLAMLPPESPWTDSKILSLLRGRPGVSGEVEVVSQIDTAKVNGYEIFGVLTKTVNTVHATEGLVTSKLFGAQFASRVYRPSQDGAKHKHVPSGIADAKTKTALGLGGLAYLEIDGQERSSLRPVVFDAIRAAIQEAAPRTVELMVETAKEIN